MKSLRTDQKTSPTLLDRIRNLENEQAWTEFVTIYRPLIQRYSLGWKLSREDAEDITQKTLAWVVDKIETYEYRPDTCPFRVWLLKKVKFLILDRFRELKEAAGDSQGNELPDSAPPPLEEMPDGTAAAWEERWEKEHQLQIVAGASQLVRKRLPIKYYQAFDMRWHQGLAPQEIADKLGVSRDYVDLAVCRFNAAVKAEVARLKREFE